MAAASTGSYSHRAGAAAANDAKWGARAPGVPFVMTRMPDREPAVPEPPRRAHGLRRGVYLVLGCFFVGSAMVGIVLPLVPTTPFLLLAAFFFARSSERFYGWLLGNRRFGPLLRQWRADRSLPPGVKPKAVALVTLVFAISIALMHERLWVQLVLLGIGAGLVVFLLRLPARHVAEDGGPLAEGD